LEPHACDADGFVVSRAWARYDLWCAVVGAQVVQGRGRSAAGDGVVAACVNSGRQAAESRECSISDCVYARVQDVQAARADAAVDGARAEPQVEQLTARDDPVLALRDRGDDGVDSTP